MQKLFLVLLLLLAAAVAWFVFSGGEPQTPVGDGTDPGARQVPVEAGTNTNAGAGSQDPGPEVGRTEVTGAGTSAAELTAGRAGEIRGRVLDPEGSPLPGAAVLLLRREGDGGFSFGQDHTATVDAKLVTDGEGWYRVRGLAAGAAWNVWAYHEDYCYAEGAAVEGFVGEDQELPPIRMSQGFVLEVRVVDMSDRGVEGARVELFADGMPEDATDDPDPLGRRFVMMSESDGFAGFESIGPGAWILRAKKEGYGDGWLRPIVILPGREPGLTRLLLGPEFGLRGSVVSAEGPVAGATIAVDTDPPGIGPGFRALSDANGEFKISGLPEGNFMLTAARRGFLSTRPEPISGDGPHELRVEMQALGTVSGRLLGADRKPARAGTIEIWRCIGGAPPYFPTDEVVAVDDPEGRFDIEFPGGGSFVLLARAEGCAPAWSEVIQTRSDPVRLGDWQLPVGATLSGVLVLGSESAPLENALLKLMPDGWFPSAEPEFFVAEMAGSSEVPPTHARSGAGGRFQLAHLPPGRYVLLVEHPEAVAQTIPFEAVDGGARDLGTIRMDAASSLLVRAYHANGKPLAGGNLVVSAKENGMGQQNQLLNAKGEARVYGLASGEYWISAVEGGDFFGKTSKPKQVWLKSGEREEVEVRIED